MKDIICSGCSLLCDDVSAEIDGDEVNSLGLCRLGHTHLAKALRHKQVTAIIRDNGKETIASQEAAIEKAADLLLAANNPLVSGWSYCSNESIEVGLSLASELRGYFDSSSNLGLMQSMAHSLHGLNLEIDLEYVRNNGEFIIYWGSNPTESLHRHSSRFAVLPRGEKIPEGIESRTIGVVDVRETETMKMANHRLIIPVGSDSELLDAVTAELLGESAITDAVLGIPAPEVIGFVRGLKKSDCTVIFYGSGVLNSGQAEVNLSAISKLIDAIRKTGNEAYALPMAPESNSMGSHSVSTRVSSISGAIDYSSGTPERDQDGSSLTKLVAGDFDLALVAGDDLLAMLPGLAARRLANSPLIYVGPKGGITDTRASVSIYTSDIMVSGNGNMTRIDATELEFKPWIDDKKSPNTMLEVLTKLKQQVQAK